MAGPWQPPQVKVVDPDAKDGQSQAVVEYVKVHADKIKGTHIFELQSDYIQSGFEHEMKSGKEMSVGLHGSSYKSRRRMSIVNVMFVNNDNIKSMLFERDVMILNARYADFNQKNTLPRVTFNLFSVVSKDGNGNGVLDYEDNQDLYRTLYNGQQRMRIMENISDYEIIDIDLLLVSREEEGEVQFYECDLQSGHIRKLNTEIKAAK